jgi:hypothetical protein
MNGEEFDNKMSGYMTQSLWSLETIAIFDAPHGHSFTVFTNEPKRLFRTDIRTDKIDGISVIHEVITALSATHCYFLYGNDGRVIEIVQLPEIKDVILE